MKEHIRQHLLKVCKELEYDQDDDGIYELLRETDYVYKELYTSRRHWDEYCYVVAIDGKFIGYVDESTTGDDAGDRGFEFDPDTICEMEPVEKVFTVYEAVV